MRGSALKSVLSLLVIESVVFGVNSNWTGSVSTSWSQSANWSALSVPNSSTDALFSPLALTNNVDVEGPILNVNSLNFNGTNFQLIGHNVPLSIYSSSGLLLGLVDSTVSCDDLQLISQSSSTITLNASSTLNLIRSSLNGVQEGLDLLITGSGSCNLSTDSFLGSEENGLRWGTMTLNQASLSLQDPTNEIYAERLLLEQGAQLCNNSGLITLSSGFSQKSNASVSSYSGVIANTCEFIEIKDSARFFQQIGEFGQNTLKATISGGFIRSLGTYTAPYQVNFSSFISGRDLYDQNEVFTGTSTFFISGTPSLYFEGCNAFTVCTGTMTGGSITVKGLIEKFESEEGERFFSNGSFKFENFDMNGDSVIHLIGGNLIGDTTDTPTRNRAIFSSGTIVMDCYVDQNGKLARPAFLGSSERSYDFYPYTFQNAFKLINNGGYLGGGTACEFILKDEAFIENLGLIVGDQEVSAGIYQKLSVHDHAQILTNQLSLIKALISMTGGTIHNDGVILSSFDLQGGAISGNGTLTCDRNCFIGSAATVTQNILNFSTADDPLSILEGPRLFNMGALIANQVIVKDFASLSGEGTIEGLVQAYGSGYIYPGYPIVEEESAPYVGDLTLNGNIRFYKDSILKVDIYQGETNQLILPTGQLTMFPGSQLFVHLHDVYTNPTDLIVAKLNSRPSGLFTVVTDQPLLNLSLSIVQPTNANQLSYEINGYNYYIVLNATRNPFTVLGGYPNQVAVERTLDQLFGQTNICLQDKMDAIISDTPQEALEIFSQMQNSELKSHQVTLEELVFATNDQFKPYLYTTHKGARPFAFASYNYQNQRGFYQYLSYQSVSEYEFVGLSYGLDTWQLLGAIGSMQSKTRIKTKPSSANSTSINTAFGLSGFSKRWTWGADLLTGYYWTKTRRHIPYYDLVGRSSHQMWNFKTAFHGDYLKTFKDWDFKVYDDLTYYWGRENAYNETGAQCLSLSVDGSIRQVIRNAIGLRGEFLKSQHIHPYIDLAYVFEDRLSGRYYHARFDKTGPKMKVEGVEMAKNFAKLNFGLAGNKNSTYFQINIAGQYGSRYFEQEISGSVDYKF